MPRHRLDRRTMLRASGISLALPLLESMAPACAEMPAPPRRLVTICTTLGLHGPAFWPNTPGASYEPTTYLELLGECRNDMTLFSGLCHEGQSGRRPHDSEATWLTAARNPGISGFRNTISVDQVAAGAIGESTRFPSITLSSNNALSQSYTDNGVMIPATTRPSQLFSDLFLKGSPQQIRRQRQRLEDGRSILDQLGAEMKRVRRESGAADVRLLDEYFDAVRDAERNISKAQGWMQKPKPNVAREQPTDIRDKRDITGRVRLLMDLIPLILQTDSSRVITVMIQDHNTVPKIAGVVGDHHNLSHHARDPDKIRQLLLVESGLVRCFADLLEGLKSGTEAGTTLLKNTSVLFGSNLGNANVHNTKNLPIILAGGGYKHGQFVACPDNTPLSNLFLTLLNDIGVESDAFGQSTGTLRWPVPSKAG